MPSPAACVLIPRPVLVIIRMQEVEAITTNTDKAQGPVFKPSRTDYQDTFTLGAKDSKQRTQYDTGVHIDPDRTTVSLEPALHGSGMCGAVQVCGVVQISAHSTDNVLASALKGH